MSGAVFVLVRGRLLALLDCYAACLSCTLRAITVTRGSSPAERALWHASPSFLDWL